MRLVKNDPSLAVNLLAVLSKRLKYFTRLVESLSLKEVPQRLATYLLYFRGGYRENSVDLAISKSRLASLLGTIPETLSCILNKMAAQGLIEVQGRRIRLIDRPAIEKLAKGEKLSA
jgi:CRP/FNR family transcriptional regulator